MTNMNWEQRLRRETTGKTVTRTVTISIHPDTAWFIVTTSDVTITGDEFQSTSTGSRHKEHRQTWEDALACAQQIVRSSEAEGMALLPRNAI
jgi:hypothetical protein